MSKSIGKFDFKILIEIFLVIIILVMIGGLGFLSYKYVQLQNQIDESEESTLKKGQTQEEEAKIVIEEFRKFVAFNEEPTVAEIIDIEKLKVENPTFYQNVINGDKMLIFSERNLAFIFRREEQKIINVAVINLNPSSTTGLE